MSALFPMSDRVQAIDARLAAFMQSHITEAEAEFARWDHDPSRRWSIPPLLEELKAKAKSEGLWNLFLPDPHHGAGLNNLEYARLAERMGRSIIASEIFNCSAPDTGNMEVLHLFGNSAQKAQWLMPLLAGEIRSAFAMTEPDVASSDATNIALPIVRDGDDYVINGRKWWTTGNMEVLHLFGNDAQKAQWLMPLLAGEIRSAFAMTEPDVASSDATNIALPIVRDGDHYVVNGRKWWTTGAGDPRCKILIVMGVTDPAAPAHRRQSMVLVPMDTPGLRVVRPLQVFGYDDAPHGHVEMAFENVRVPVANLIHEQGSGFEIAQMRLGPGRIHHCMRLIGLAQRALEMMVDRARTRVAFGVSLGKHGMAQEAIALSRCEIEQARLLTLQAAATLDAVGNKGAKDLIGMIKIVAPRMACAVIDRAIQIHGGGGLSQDHFLAQAYAGARSLRLADGPDEVHIAALARSMLKS